MLPTDLPNATTAHATTALAHAPAHPPLQPSLFPPSPPGAQGVVYEGVWQGATVAVKFSIVEDLDTTAYELLFSRLLCHPNVVTTFVAKVRGGAGRGGAGRGGAGRESVFVGLGAQGGVEGRVGRGRGWGGGKCHEQQE